MYRNKKAVAELTTAGSFVFYAVLIVAVVLVSAFALRGLGFLPAAAEVTGVPTGPCTNGETQELTCADGTVIITHTCVSSQWVATAQTCPSPAVAPMFTGQRQVTFSGEDILNPGTAITGMTIPWWRNGNYMGTVNETQAITAIADGDAIDVLGTAAGYYGQVMHGNVIGLQTLPFFFQMYPNATIANVRVTVKDPDDETNAAATPYNLNAGDRLPWEIKITPEFQAAFGNPYTATLMDEHGKPALNVLTCQGNKSAYDVVTYMGLASASTPGQHAVPATHTAWSAYVDQRLLAGTALAERMSIIATVDVDNTNGPVNDSINCTMYDADFFRHTQDNTIQQGVENDQDTDLGGGQITVNFIEVG